MFRSLLSQNYLPIRKLAEGGMGEIYLARQAGLAGFQREVVLKRVHHRLSDDAHAVEMFLDEARLAAALSHANVVQIYDVGEEDGAYLIVMERVRGLSLRELAETTSRRRQMIPMELSLTIIAQVLEGLRHAHAFRDDSGRSVRIVHRDICPSNILVSEDGVVKIADFGIARAESRLRQEGGPRPGKFAYMSPEAVRGEPMDARADLFSVGVLLYELTVGQRLFRAGSFEELQRVVAERIAPPTFARAGYPVDLEILVMRALERNPDDRFQSAEELLEALEEFAFDTGMRLSRLRLARFVGRVLGEGDTVIEPMMEASSPDVGAEMPAEDLDFDQRGIFDQRGSFDQRIHVATSAREPEQVSVQQRRVLEAVAQANEAIAELVAQTEDESKDESEDQHTRHMRVSDQAALRARSVGSDPDVVRVASVVTGLRDGSALVVTDELVEEELDLAEGDPGDDLLRAPLVEVSTPGEALALEAPFATPIAADERETPPMGTPLPPALHDPELAPRAFTDPTRLVRVEPSPPSTDLIQALADISAELQAAAASDRRREKALGEAVEALGGEAPDLVLDSVRGTGAPPPAAVPPAPATLPAPLLLGAAPPALSGPFTGIVSVRDELEAADGASRRQFDDLELSDFGPPPEADGREEDFELEADGETIVLQPEDASVMGDAGRPALTPPPSPPSPPPPLAAVSDTPVEEELPSPPSTPAPPPTLEVSTVESPTAGADDRAAAAASASDHRPAVRAAADEDDEGLDAPTHETSARAAADQEDEGLDAPTHETPARAAANQDDEGLDAPTLVLEKGEGAREKPGGRGKRRKRKRRHG